MSKKLHVLIVLSMLVGLVGVFAQPAAAQEPVKELTILWAEWDPATYLAELVKDYETETGVKVTVKQEPWSSFADVVSKEWAAKGTAFDMVVGDSQWLGQGATQGHYVDLTDFLTTTGLKDTVTPATLDLLRRVPDRLGQVLGLPDRG